MVQAYVVAERYRWRRHVGSCALAGPPVRTVMCNNVAIGAKRGVRDNDAIRLAIRAAQYREYFFEVPLRLRHVSLHKWSEEAARRVPICNSDGVLPLERVCRQVRVVPRGDGHSPMRAEGYRAKALAFSKEVSRAEAPTHHDKFDSLR